MRLLLSLSLVVLTYELPAVGRVSLLVNEPLEERIDWQASGGGNYFKLLTPEDYTGNAAEEEDAAQVYCPISDGASQSHFVLANPIPNIASGMVRARLTIDNQNSSQGYHLHTAVKGEDDGYTVVWRDATVYSGAGLKTGYPTFPLQQVCNFGSRDECERLEDGEMNDNEDFLIYFFLSEDGLPEGTQIDPTDWRYAGGAYFRLFLSDDVIDEGNLSSVSVGNLVKGDGRLSLGYSMTRPRLFHSLYAVVRTTPTPLSSNTIDGYIADRIDPLEGTSDAADEGRVWVSDLDNGTEYFVGLVAGNMYRFATRVSEFRDGIPLEQLDVLDGNCYILSAGFRRHHFVVEYFRFLRDRLLPLLPLGQKLIDFYYRTAPEYALVIYDNPLLGFLVRMGVYAVFFLINVGTAATVFFVFILGLKALGRRRNF